MLHTYALFHLILKWPSGLDISINSVILKLKLKNRGLSYLPKFPELITHGVGIRT